MSARTFEWNWVCKTTIEPSGVKTLKSVSAIHDHPLKSSSAILLASDVKSVAKENVLTDPLSSNFEGSDPLSAMAAQEDWDELDQDMNPSSKPKKILESFENPWIEQRTAILNKFTTTQKLSMYSGSSHSTASKDITNPSLRNKLDQLDDFDEITLLRQEQLSQAEYVETVNGLGRELATAWNQDLRVKALKIAIQCAKLLADTSVVQFYPSKFVLITDVLDQFGNLVYERLLSKAYYFPQNSRILAPLPENFTPDMVPESAKETCRNWFYKIASIRELIPRLYVEAAVLKSYTFLAKSELLECVKRLTAMSRGLGDPLVSVYTRCYLSRIGQGIVGAGPGLIRQNLLDFLMIYHQLFSPSIHQQLSIQKIDLTTYLGVYVPALDWMFQGLVNSGDLDMINELFKKSMEKRNKGLLLNSILSTYKPDYIAQNAEVIIRHVASCFGEGFPVESLLKSFGEKLRDQTVSNSKNLKYEAWRLISKLENHAAYLSCVQAWIPFIIAYSTIPELNIILGNIIERISNSAKQFHMTVHDIVITIVSTITDLDLVFTMDKFLPLVDLVRDEPTRVLACQKILETYCRWKSDHSTADPVTTDALIFIAKVLHDSVNALTVQDEKRQYGNLISQLIQKIEFSEFEQQLRFYVDARATFMNLDSVIVTLVHCVNRLGMERGRKVKGHHTRRTGAFVHACTAYSYISIPSVSCTLMQLRLYLLTAQIALFNQSLGQADACIASALALLPKVPQTIEIDGKSRPVQPYLSEFVKNMLSTLIVVPDCPEEGVLYLSRGLVNMLQQCSGRVELAPLTRLYLDVIRMMCVSARPEYPYHVRKVDSNDVLYGSDPKFLAEINKMCSILLEEILNNLQALGERKEYSLQADVSLELFHLVMNHVHLELEGMAKLAYQLWNLSKRHNCRNEKLAVKELESLKHQLPLYPANSAFSLLLAKLKV